MFGFVSGGPLESQLDFMRQVSAQVAVAVDNTLNFENAEKYQRQLARERDRLQVLLEITNALVSELDIRELFPSITACLRRVMPSEYSSLALLETDGAALKNYALVFEGNPDIIPQGATAALDETPAGRAVETRRPVVLDADGTGAVQIARGASAGRGGSEIVLLHSFDHAESACSERST